MWSVRKGKEDCCLDWLKSWCVRLKAEQNAGRCWNFVGEDDAVKPKIAFLSSLTIFPCFCQIKKAMYYQTMCSPIGRNLVS